MEKIILQPKENYNPNKLSGEMYAANIECWISFGEQEYTLEYQNATAEQVQTVLDAHDPTPEPEPPTETELLREQVQMLDGALNEVLFTILPEIQGGEI
ncbi:hypothetical protein LI142_07040 [Eubacterium limosum]|uniref:hypothetical protein n=1 Tax=Eubacterium limosum TaxID=1736 RepID=UPI001D07DEDA|nr:hypothetical protein [Eubacterium limosum]MCB6569258.1 hypothetical protein [Eubacterium limosum]